MEGGGVVVRLIGRTCAAMWGFTPNVMPAMVEQMGQLRAARWFLANFPRFLVTYYVLGSIRTHLAALTISLHNGCNYCANGRIRALELIYLRDHGRLFPLDARTVEGWHDLDAREIGARLRTVLEEAGLHAEVMWVDTTLALVAGDAEPVDSTEARIAHLCRMVGRMNAIAIETCVPLDGPHDSVNKDTALKERLALLQTGVG
jgi:alkylhydroperoxidase family enzyme